MHNATCTRCGCVCDDIELHADTVRIVEARNACHLGQEWFLSHTAERSYPEALIDGRETSAEEAIRAAADLLDQARLPLVFGLSNLTCEAQREAVALAERLGGVIDCPRLGAAEIATQLCGKVTCTLGEVKNRADLLIYWRVDPIEAYPRHLDKFVWQGDDKFRRRGRQDRTLVVIDMGKTKSVEQADVFVQIEADRDFEVLTLLRALVKRQRIDPRRVAATGLMQSQLDELVHRMTSAQFGVLMFDLGLSAARGAHMNVGAVLALVAELNEFTRFAALPMREYGNVAGIDISLRSATGYPFAVDFSRGYPRYNPGEFSTIDLLDRGEVDAALILGLDPGVTIPKPALDHLARIPTVVLNPHIYPDSRRARVHLTTAATGVSSGGTAYRMDEMPLPLRPALRSSYPGDEEVIRRIRQLVAGKPDWLCGNAQTTTIAGGGDLPAMRADDLFKRAAG